MNLHFKDVSNWPRIEQSLMTLLRSSESLSVIHYPIFENCQLMTKHQLSPQVFEGLQLVIYACLEGFDALFVELYSRVLVD